jgi:hypothetical protein
MKRETKKEMTVYTTILRVSMFEGANISESSICFNSLNTFLLCLGCVLDHYSKNQK